MLTRKGAANGNKKAALTNKMAIYWVDDINYLININIVNNVT